MKINILKIFGKFLKIFLIVYVLFWLFIFEFTVLISDKKNILTNPKDYPKAYTSVENQNKISHFPQKIPTDAKNVKMYCKTSQYGENVFLLEFSTDKNYIQQELNKHKFINKDTKIGENQTIYHFYSNNGIKPDGYTFFVIDDNENREYSTKYFPYYSGIGINKAEDKILYYFFYPSD